MGFKPITTPTASKGTLGSLKCPKYFIHLSLISLDINRIARAPFSSQDKYIINRQRTPNPQLSMQDVFWKETNWTQVKNPTQEKTKASGFHSYHDIGGNNIGIVADRFNEEHLQSTAKLSWKPAVRFRTFSQLLLNPAFLPASPKEHSLHLASILSIPSTQDQERSPIPAAKSTLQQSIMRITYHW